MMKALLDGEVRVFTSPQCAGCELTKKRFAESDVTYIEVDIQKDPGAVEYLDQLGYSSVPVVETRNHSWSGFRITEIDELIQGTLKNGLSGFLDNKIQVIGVGLNQDETQQIKDAVIDKAVSELSPVLLKDDDYTIAIVADEHDPEREGDFAVLMEITHSDLFAQDPDANETDLGRSR
jgi:glutaredoxin